MLKLEVLSEVNYQEFWQTFKIQSNSWRRFAEQESSCISVTEFVRVIVMNLATLCYSAQVHLNFNKSISESENNRLAILRGV